ncbi:MAG: LCP family protein [Eubacteriales bacterium]|jgi:LCP family protein required for cell wall assembly
MPVKNTEDKGAGRNPRKESGFYNASAIEAAKRRHNSSPQNTEVFRSGSGGKNPKPSHPPTAYTPGPGNAPSEHQPERRYAGGYFTNAQSNPSGQRQNPANRNTRDGRPVGRNQPPDQNRANQNPGNGASEGSASEGRNAGGRSSGRSREIRKSARQTRRTRLMAAMIIAAVLLTLLIVGASYLNYKPNLGDGLFNTAPDIGKDINAETTTSDGRPERYAAETFTRSNEDRYNFLILGKDKVAYNTDVIMILNFDVKTGAINILQIPRDTMFRINGNRHKANALYAVYYNYANKIGESDPVSYGLQSLADTIEQNLKIKIDFWALCTLDGFGEIVDALGGVEMNVPFDMDYEDPDQDLYIHIKEGKQVLDGETAQYFMRFRSNYIEGDIGRVKAQKLFFSALMKTFKEKFTIAMIPDLAKAVFQNIKTSIEYQYLGYFARKALGADLSTLKMITLPGEAIQTGSGAWYYVTKRADARAIVNLYFNVFDQQITDAIFDPNQNLTDGMSSAAYKVYHSLASENPAEKYVLSGTEADEKGIKIDLLDDIITTAAETSPAP